MLLLMYTADLPVGVVVAVGAGAEGSLRPQGCSSPVVIVVGEAVHLRILNEKNSQILSEHKNKSYWYSACKKIIQNSNQDPNMRCMIRCNTDGIPKLKGTVS